MKDTGIDLLELLSHLRYEYVIVIILLLRLGLLTCSDVVGGGRLLGQTTHLVVQLLDVSRQFQSHLVQQAVVSQ